MPLGIPVLKPDKTAVRGFGIPVARKEGESPDSYLKRIMVRAKEAVNDPDMFLKHMRESADLKDHLSDFYDPMGYIDYKIHEANANYVNEHYPYPYRFLAKEMSRRIACKERNKDKDNPKWRKDNTRCD